VTGQRPFLFTARHGANTERYGASAKKTDAGLVWGIQLVDDCRPFQDGVSRVNTPWYQQLRMSDSSNPLIRVKAVVQLCC